MKETTNENNTTELLKKTEELLRFIHKNNNNYRKQEISPEDLEKSKKIAAYEYLKNIQDKNQTQRRAIFYEIRHNLEKHSLMDYLLTKKYIITLTEYNWEKYATEIDENELITIIKNNDLTPANTKEELIKQIKDNVNIKSLNYHTISEEGLEFINNNTLLEYYTKYLETYTYYKFENYVNNLPETMTIKQKVLKYLEEVENETYLINDRKEYQNIQTSRAKLYEDTDDPANAMKYYIKTYICNINPRHLQKYKDKTYTPIDEDISDKLKKINLENQLNIEKIFFEALNETELYTAIVPEKEMYSYLEKILNNRDIIELNANIINNIKLDEHNNLYYEKRDVTTTLDNYF